MPPATVAKQRVRTGCLTCRKRRRKCDERKPSCDNCEVRRVECKYRSELTFVSVSNPGRQQSKVRSKTSAVTSGSVTLAGAESLTTSIQKDERARYGDAPDGSITAPDVGINSTPELAARPPTGSVRSPRFPGNAAEQTILPNASSLLINNNDTVPIGSTHNGSQSRTSAPLPPSFVDQLAPRRALTSSKKETDLLRHFRYNLSSLLDVGDPGCSFGLKIMLLARAKRPLMAAILALAARQSLLISGKQHGDDLENSLGLRDEAEQGLVFEEDHIRHLGNVLLILGEFFSSSPQEWRDLLFYQMGIPDSLVSLASVQAEDLGEPLFWIHFRIGISVHLSDVIFGWILTDRFCKDLAASIISGQPPLTPFHSYLLRGGSWRTSSRSDLEQPSTKQVYQHSLFLLASCLSLVFGDQRPDSLRPEALFHTISELSFSTQWTGLWVECQKWYNDRPVEVQQILDIRGVEAEELDTKTPSSFPILIYTTPLAVVSNAVYHITCLFLLTYKPRLLDSLTGPRCFSSYIWHAQSIAGIATSNEYLEQWDPILIAGLLLTAKDMTHESQQTVLLERLWRITTMTGIKLHREIEALSLGWHISRYNEEIAT